MKRRIFVEYMSLLGIAVVIPFYNCSSESNDLKIISLPLILNNIITKNEIIEIGKKYLENGKRKYSQNELVSNILNGNELVDQNFNILDFIKNKIILDFSNDKVVIFKGWILSETEVLQCALYSQL